MRPTKEAAGQKRPRDWSWKPWPNRVVYCVLTALAINAWTDTMIGWTVGLILFVLTSAIVSIRR